jgi:hypothetical protein
MKPVPRVSRDDISRAFISDEGHMERLEIVATFKQRWQVHLGYLFEVPSDNQIFTWAKIAKWDTTLLAASIEDLRCRAKHPMDSYEHGLRHFSAALIRRMRGKYGMPPEKAAA